MSARCCVIICYWVGRSPAPLYSLLRQMERVPAGAEFDVLVVCNGGDTSPLRLPPLFDGEKYRVLNRANSGWNLGAWQAGWKAQPDYDYYLFLQAECFIKKPNWLGRFLFRFSLDSGIGLLGERLMWQGMTWEYVREATAIDIPEAVTQSPEILDSLREYQAALRAHDIDPGRFGTHLVSVVLFTSLEILKKTDGFIFLGDKYSEAVSTEIGFSRKVENLGYRIAQLTDDSFGHIGHTQWTDMGVLFRLTERLRERLYRLRRS